MYKAIHFRLDPLKSEFVEILSALLDVQNFEGIFENDKNIIAYINEGISVEEILDEIQSSMVEIGCSISWKTEKLPDKNWNEIWESNFEPITISNQCVIRAPFHPEFSDIRYQIIIEPKMSFGTGHHQTTRLMIELMLEIDFANQKVLDMGCGTGILGILAALKNASKVVAVDTDRWAFENATENAKKNNILQISVLQGDTKAVISEKFDFILANINRNILIEQMRDYSLILKPEGTLLLSGILTDDVNSVKKVAEKNRFTFVKKSELDNWAAMMFERN